MVDNDRNTPPPPPSRILLKKGRAEVIDPPSLFVPIKIRSKIATIAGRERWKSVVALRGVRSLLQNLLKERPNLVHLLLGFWRYADRFDHRHCAPRSVVGVHPCQRLLGAKFRVKPAKKARGDEPGPAPACPTVDENHLQLIVLEVLSADWGGGGGSGRTVVTKSGVKVEYFRVRNIN